MLQKVDLSVAHVAMVTHVCFKRIFKCSIYLQTYVASVSSDYFKSRSGVYTCCNGAGGSFSLPQTPRPGPTALSWSPTAPAPDLLGQRSRGDGGAGAGSGGARASKQEARRGVGSHMRV